MVIIPKKIKYKNLGFFRFKKLGQKYLLTNEEGEHAYLNEADFKDFIEGRLDKNKEPYLTLVSRNFVKTDFNANSAIAKYRSKRSFLFAGPSLHIVVVTLRCNHRCVYCHASAHNMAKQGVDMTQETAVKVLDIIFQTTSPFVALEFQGGEPLANWPVVKFIIEEAQKKAKAVNKELQIRLLSNFSLMTKAKYKYLLQKNVSLCTSLDGPKKVHNKNRILIDGKKVGDSHQHVAKWLKRFIRDYPKLERKKYIWRAGGLSTISRFSLPYYKEIVDEYMKLGYDNIFLRPLNPFGFSREVWQKISYTSEEFIDFYKKTMDYIIVLNLSGKKFRERFSLIFLTKILTDYDLNMMDYRSPCGAGVGQVAYNYNGDVYTCDEGRMLSMMGDENFRLGNVFQNNYQELMSSPALKTTCLASCLAGVAGCSECVYQPYCGSCPIYNYSEQGDIFGQMPTNGRCKINQAILGYLFNKLQDEKVRAIFESWLKK